MAVPTDPRRGKPWVAWIVVLAVVGVVVWLITAYAGGERPSTTAASEAAPPAIPGATAPDANGAASQAKDAITDLSMIAAGNKDELDGRDVALAGVTVDSRSGKNGFWISKGGPRVFVEADEDDLRNASEGKTVNVRGKLKKAPDEFPEDWGVTGDHATTLKQLGLYIDADEVAVGTQH